MPIVHDLDNLPNVRTHVHHATLAFHPLDVRATFKYVLETSVINIFWGNSHAIPPHQLPIHVNSHAILFPEPMQIDLPLVSTTEIIDSLTDSVKQ